MTEEIKEILENLKEISEFEYTTDWFELNFKDAKILLNYITNLQKENNGYKQRNEKAVEYIKTQEVDFVDVHYQQQDDYFEKLLNILKGGDE